jgi:hypothetical protein
MNAHRFFGEGEIRSIPRSRTADVSVQGFVVCPRPLMARFGETGFGLGVQEIYRLAYEQAKACVAPPWHLQSLLSGTN